MIDRHELRALAALDAAGALTDRERDRLRALLAAAPDELRREVASLYDSSSALAAGLKVEAPAASVRDRILAHAAKHP